jgi:uncharacterized membrane protein
MPSLTVWRYPTPLGVEAGELLLRRLEERGALTVHDAVTVIWMPGADQPDVRRVRHRTAGAAGRGTFWGALVGTLVLAPVAGAAVGATAAAVASRLRHAGVPAETVSALTGALTPGTSALFVVTSDADPAVVGPAVADTEAELIHAEVDDRTAAELRLLLEP